MDVTHAESLIAEGETLGVEFKEDPENKPLASEAIMRAIVGLANAEGGQGGTLVIGVSDDGLITGIGPNNKNLSHGDPNKVEGFIRNKTVPSLVTHVSFVEMNGKRVVLIEVPGSPEPVGTRDGTFRRRTIGPDGRPANIPYNLSDMFSQRIMIMDQDYATIPLPRATMDDLDPGELDSFRKRANEPGCDSSLANLSNTDILRALRLLTTEQNATTLAVGAILLFGRPEAVARFVPTAEVAFQSLSGTLLARNDIKRLPLFRAADFLFDAVETALSSEPQPELTLGMRRIPLPTISAPAVRECVANALIHRDYAVLDKVSVQLNSTGMSVVSPGGLPYGINLSNLLEETRPRSVALADAFKRVGYVERTGRGIPRMYIEQLRNGQSAPDYSRTTGDRVIVWFSVGRSDAELALFFHQWEASGRETLTARELQAIRAIRDLRDPTTDELSDRLTISADATRTLARRLADLDCVEIRGRGTGRHYVLSPLITAMTRGAAVYIPSRDQALADQQEAILDFVRATGAITRGQVADLCHITPATATHTLKTLVQTERLMMIGRNRGARYILPEEK